MSLLNNCLKNGKVILSTIYCKRSHNVRTMAQGKNNLYRSWKKIVKTNSRFVQVRKSYSHSNFPQNKNNVIYFLKILELH